MHSNNHNIKTITLGISGASGMPYAIRLLQCLIQADKEVHVVISQAAQVVLALESELDLPHKVDSLQEFLTAYCDAKPDQLIVYGHQQWIAPIASGSNITDAMIVCPCSSGCLSAIATGASNNLLERAADVTLKEQKRLILVSRETPLSAIHLENMLKLAKLGVSIIPACPGFYNKPQKVDDLIDFVVARILDHVSIEHTLTIRWGSN